ncbi:hypothetical protein [Turicimonas muris]|nr:hypothetical protein [Turicimonas muris]
MQQIVVLVIPDDGQIKSGHASGGHIQLSGSIRNHVSNPNDFAVRFFVSFRDKADPVF